ncbi:MAG TPA: hypothetical protein VFV09_00365, partial [Actinomycetota bacterium]|nr:hypothetical protein [Actinomycetota bacterium]
MDSTPTTTEGEESPPEQPDSVDPPDTGSRRRTRPLPAPEGVPPRVYFAGLLGPLLLMAGLGVQMVLAGVVLMPTADQPDNLTPYGRFLYIADRDLQIFAVSTIVAILLAVASVRIYSRRFDTGAEPAAIGRRLVVQAAAALAAVLVSLAGFLWAREYVKDGSDIPGVYLLFAGALAAVTVILTLLPPPRRTGPGGSQWERLAGSSGEPVAVRLKLSPLDLAVPVILVLLIYVPDWRQLAGRFFYEESLFHWDFFSMAPALAFAHGKALGTDAYSMYGVGWPMLFGGLTRWVPLSYGRMIQIGSIYACVYLTGVYALLRLLTRRSALAALGVAVILLQLFLWQSSAVIWRFASLTMMRWPFDVWCFIAVLLFWRTGRRIWALAAGAAVGMALLFATDTGLYLAAALTFYWLATLRLSTGKRKHLVDAALSVVVAFVVLIAGLLVASRGGLFTLEFVEGWLQAILEFGGGFAQLPMATAPNAVTVAAFALLFFCYLTLIGWSLARLVHNRASHFEVFNGFLAVYGLLMLVHFVGRSGDYTPFHLWIPLALVAVNLAGRFWDYAEPGLAGRGMAPSRRWIAQALPFVGVAVAVGLFALLGPRSMLRQPIADYPSLASKLAGAGEPDGLCLIEQPKDLCGLPAQQEPTVNHVRAVAARLASIVDQG